VFNFLSLLSFGGLKAIAAGSYASGNFCIQPPGLLRKETG